jgi:hypothetical protein
MSNDRNTGALRRPSSNRAALAGLRLKTWDPTLKRGIGLTADAAKAVRRPSLRSCLEWTPPAEPFFQSLSSWRAVWDSNPRHED